MAMSSVAGVRAFASVVAAKKQTTAVRAVVTKAGTEELYVEPGASTYSGNYDEALWPNWTNGKSDEEITKIAERELMHGRWAMLGCAGAWGAECGTGINWFQAGAVCTPADCTGIVFPGQVIPLAPEGSGFPKFYNVLAGTLFLMGLSEAYRTGLQPPVFPELEVGDLHPGGEHFDPLGLSESEGTTFELEKMKIVELKHARLAMLSWLGYMSQAVATNCDNPFGIGSETWPSYIEGAKGPYANWQDHVADPFVENVWKYVGLFQ
jgi:light-harvesting complex II chlorophyll a/b binding protein 4